MRGLFHMHIRKRAAGSALEPFPARTGWLRLLDRVVLLGGIAGPAASLPQVLRIYVGQEARGVEPITWGMWALLDVPWILYGIVHRERPITITYLLWFTVNALVCAGAIIYG